jgi:putative transposase
MRPGCAASKGRFDNFQTGTKHLLGVIEGATENAVVVQALLDNLIERGLDPTVCRLFIVDGAQAVRKAVRTP